MVVGSEIVFVLIEISGSPLFRSEFGRYLICRTVKFGRVIQAGSSHFVAYDVGRFFVSENNRAK